MCSYNNYSYYSVMTFASNIFTNQEMFLNKLNILATSKLLISGNIMTESNTDAAKLTVENEVVTIS